MNRSTPALFAAALALLPLPGLAAPAKTTPKHAAATPTPAPVPVAVPAPLPPVAEPVAPAVVEPPAKVDPETFRGKITAVDRAEQTLVVKLEKRGLRTIYIVQLPKGAEGRAGVTWDQLKVGAEVEGVMRKDGRKLVAETLAVVR